MYYDKLIEAWTNPTQPPPGVTGAPLTGAMSTQGKVNAINEWTCAGPLQDVALGDMFATLLLTGAWLPIVAFAQGSPTSVSLHDAALRAAQMMVALFASPNAPQMIRMSDPDVYAQVTALVAPLLAYELTGPTPSTGFTQVTHDAVLGLADTVSEWTLAAGYGYGISTEMADQAGLA